MMFTSGTQRRQKRTVNHDPEPYVEGVPPIHYGQRHSHFEDVEYRGCTYAPRPEFGVMDNTVLDSFRGAYETDTVSLAQEAREWLVEVLPEWMAADWEDVTPERVDHAARVLTRLVALGGTDD